MKLDQKAHQKQNDKEKTKLALEKVRTIDKKWTKLAAGKVRTNDKEWTKSILSLLSEKNICSVPLR